MEPRSNLGHTRCKATKIIYVYSGPADSSGYVISVAYSRMSLFGSIFGSADGAKLQFTTNTPGVQYTFTAESRNNVYSCIRVAFGFDSGGQPTLDALTSDAGFSTLTATPPGAAAVTMTFTNDSILIPFSLLGFMNMGALQGCLNTKFAGQWSIAATGNQSAALLGGMASVKGGYRRGRKSRRRKNRKSRKNRR